MTRAFALLMSSLPLSLLWRQHVLPGRGRPPAPHAGPPRLPAAYSVRAGSLRALHGALVTQPLIRWVHVRAAASSLPAARESGERRARHAAII